MKKSSAHSYFRITGNFDCMTLCKALETKSTRFWNAGDIRHIDGKSYDFSNLEICHCDEFDMLLSDQQEKVIASLLEKIDLLNKLREEFDLSYSLVSVVDIAYASNGIYSLPTPCLSPSLTVMDFCTAVRAELDVDYYII